MKKTREKKPTRKMSKSELASLIGERIKHYRKESGLTLREVARQTEYTAGYVSLLEKGDATPNSYVITQLANVMSIPVSYILGEEQEINKERVSDPVLTNPANEEYIKVLKYIISKGISPKEIKDTIKFLERIKQDAG